MITGTQYLRDPNPPEQKWDTDLSRIAEAGMAVVGCWIPWRYVNPEAGQWDLKKYHRFFDIAQKKGLSVRIQLYPESAPDWAARKHRNCLYTDIRGEKIELRAASGNQLGGWPGLNFDHDTVRCLTKDYIEKIVMEFAGHSAVWAWNVWNEVDGYLISFDEACHQRYQRFLETFYEEIGSYNEKYRTRFQSFAEVPFHAKIIADQGPLMFPYAIDHYRFSIWRTQQEMDRRISIIRSLDGRNAVHSHTNANTSYQKRSNDWSLTDRLDAFGSSIHTGSVFTVRAACARTRSIGQNKHWGITEFCPSSLPYFLAATTNSLEFLESAVLNAWGEGADYMLFWQYRSERYGEESPNFNLVDFNGNPNERLKLVSRLSSFFNKNEQLSKPTEEVGILCEPFDQILSSASNRWQRQPWNNQSETRSLIELCLDLGISYVMLDPGDIIRNDIPAKLKFIFAPCFIFRNSLIPKLRNWISAGGTLVTGPFAGLFDENGWGTWRDRKMLMKGILPINTIDRIIEDRFEIACHFGEHKQKPSAIQGRYFTEIVTLAKGGGTILGTIKGRPSIIRGKFGKGHLIHSTVFLGAAYRPNPDSDSETDKNNDRKMLKWISGLLDQADVERCVRTNGKVWIRTLSLNAKKHIIVQNPSQKTVNGQLRFSASQAITLRDVFSNEIFKKTGKQHFFVVPLSSEKSRLLEIRESA